MIELQKLISGDNAPVVNPAASPEIKQVPIKVSPGFSDWILTHPSEIYGATAATTVAGTTVYKFGRNAEGAGELARLLKDIGVKNEGVANDVSEWAFKIAKSPAGARIALGTVLVAAVVATGVWFYKAFMEKNGTVARQGEGVFIAKPSVTPSSR